MLKNGAYTQVDAPNSQGTEINSINAQGEIAGFYKDSIIAKNIHGFVATPTDQTAMQ